MTLLRIGLVALAACTSHNTLVHLTVAGDTTWMLDQYVLRIGDKSATAAALPAFDVEVPDSMAGQPATLGVWGYSAGQSVAYGMVNVTPALHATVNATVTLVALACPDACEQEGETVCSGEATITCTLATNGCLAWSTPDACAAATPYCSNGACAATCSNECTTVGQTECDGDQVRTCMAVTTDTCLHWSVPVACDMPPAPTCASATTLTVSTGTCANDACAYEPTTVTCTTSVAHATATCASSACGFACDEGYTPAGESCVAIAGELVLFGGFGSDSDGSLPYDPLNDTWTFDGTNWTQVTVSNPPPVRDEASMATLGNELVLFGGFNSSSGVYLNNDTWTFDGSWAQVAVSNPPPVRQGASMATLGNKLVLFGGYNIGSGSGAYLSDTWTFDGTSWTQVAASNPLPARAGASMATLGDELVLFGGYNGSGTYLRDTWAFDGTNWTQVTASNPPSGRSDATMATLGTELVLFGGYNSGSGGGAYLSDTWTFDGTSWTPVTVSNPPSARVGASMATLGNELVLFGGYNSGSGDGAYLSDTWTFDGTSWTPVTVSNPPPGRWFPAMAVLP